MVYGVWMGMVIPPSRFPCTGLIPMKMGGSLVWQLGDEILSPPAQSCNSWTNFSTFFKVALTCDLSWRAWCHGQKWCHEAMPWGFTMIKSWIAGQRWESWEILFFHGGFWEKHLQLEDLPGISPSVNLCKVVYPVSKNRKQVEVSVLTNCLKRFHSNSVGVCDWSILKPLI